MPMELDIVGLTPEQRTACCNTISPNTFFMLVGDALVSEESLSVVRMGDGEKTLYEFCKSHPNSQITDQPYGEAWLHTFGCCGIPTDELERRLKTAAEDCTYFAPQIMGIQRQQWGVADMFARRPRMVDNWFVRTWSTKLQDQLLKQAGQVLFIHGDGQVRDAFSSRALALGVRVGCIAMMSWEQGDSTIEEASSNEAPLVLFSGGPANKYIAVSIAEDGCRPKVVLDLGQAAAKEWVL